MSASTNDVEAVESRPCRAPHRRGVTGTNGSVEQFARVLEPLHVRGRVGPLVDRLAVGSDAALRRDREAFPHRCLSGR